MSEYRLSPMAEADLEDIWLYTVENWSLAQADEYVRELLATADQLAKGTRRGRTVDVRANYLKYAIGRHFLFFRQTGYGIHITRILHQAMDVERHLPS